MSISVFNDATSGSDENVECLTQLGGVEESWGRCSLAVDVETQISFEDFQARRRRCALLDDPDEPFNMNECTVSISDSPWCLFVGLTRGKGLSDNVKERGYRIQRKRSSEPSVWHDQRRPREINPNRIVTRYMNFPSSFQYHIARLNYFMFPRNQIPLLKRRC